VILKYAAIGLGLACLFMIAGLPATRLVYIPLILALLYSRDRYWEKFNREHGIDIMKKLQGGASMMEVSQVGMELEAFDKELIRSLRERARMDSKAARELRSLLKTRIGILERELRKVQNADESGSDPEDFIKSALMGDLLKLRGIQQEINQLPR
jgi:hypothetical protein